MEVNSNILDYIQQQIIPKYAAFDKAHNLEHVSKVIQNSLDIAADYDVDMDKVYVIAAYHDIGLSQGREDHEKNSAIILASDPALNQWFSKADMALMAEAIEDHRASNNYEPRSIYGKIVSEADRDIEYRVILTRTIQYSLKNYPDYDFEQHFNRTYQHLKDKYGEEGYLKLWLNTEQNQYNLKKLRDRITAKEKLKTDFEIIFKECIE